MPLSPHIPLFNPVASGSCHVLDNPYSRSPWRRGNSPDPAATQRRVAEGKISLYYVQTGASFRSLHGRASRIDVKVTACPEMAFLNIGFKVVSMFICTSRGQNLTYRTDYSVRTYSVAHSLTSSNSSKHLWALTASRFRFFSTMIQSI